MSSDFCLPRIKSCGLPWEQIRASSRPKTHTSKHHRLISLRFLNQSTVESLGFDLLHRSPENLTMIEEGSETERKLDLEGKLRRLQKGDVGSQKLTKWPWIDHISAWVMWKHAMGGHGPRKSLSAVQSKRWIRCLMPNAENHSPNAQHHIGFQQAASHGESPTSNYSILMTLAHDIQSRHTWDDPWYTWDKFLKRGKAHDALKWEDWMNQSPCVTDAAGPTDYFGCRWWVLVSSQRFQWSKSLFWT